MTPAPVTEALLVVFAAITGAWVLSYLVHSSLLIGAAALLTRMRTLAPADQARLWRFVIVAPFATATLHVASPAGAPLLSLDMARLLPEALVDWRAGIVSGSLMLMMVVVLVSGWIAGVLVLRRVLGRRSPAPTSVQHEVAALAAVVGCPVPRVTMSASSLVPAAVGFSEVVVPARSVEAWSPEERRALLAHEMGHIVARDPVWFVIVGALSRVALFQPLNRFAAARMRVASEEAADDFAAHATGDPFTLASALASLASMLMLLPGGAAASGSPIVTRVSRLLSGGRPPTPVRVAMRRVASVVAIVIMALAAPGVTASPDAVASRLQWLAPSRDEPSDRMLEVRRVTFEVRQFKRELRDRLRRSFR
jgi:Zn-dependent protease with chaperone function